MTTRRGRFAFLLTCSLVLAGVDACRQQPPVLEGTWVGSYQMFPAIFDFKGDSVGVTLSGSYQQDRFEHADSAGASIIHVVRPNVWFKMVFVRDDSAIVYINSRTKIAVQKQ